MAAVCPTVHDWQLYDLNALDPRSPSLEFLPGRGGSRSGEGGEREKRSGGQEPESGRDSTHRGLLPRGAETGQEGRWRPGTQ